MSTRIHENKYAYLLRRVRRTHWSEHLVLILVNARNWFWETVAMASILYCIIFVSIENILKRDSDLESCHVSSIIYK